MGADCETNKIILIADLSGYTALTEVYGDTAASLTVAQFTGIAVELLTPRILLAGAMGDELMLLSEDAESLVKLALTLRRRVESEDKFPAMRAGIHAGEVVESKGHYFGRGINIASQIACYARGSEILATASVVEMLADKFIGNCRPLGGICLNNIDNPISLFTINDETDFDDYSAIDPVCQMPVKPNDALTCLHYRNGNYFFCSLECAQAFAARPERYAGIAA